MNKFIAILVLVVLTGCEEKRTHTIKHYSGGVLVKTYQSQGHVLEFRNGSCEFTDKETGNTVSIRGEYIIEGEDTLP
jgi:hypothetical protein